MATPILIALALYVAYRIGKRVGYYKGAEMGLAYAEQYGITHWERVQNEVARAGLQ